MALSDALRQVPSGKASPASLLVAEPGLAAELRRAAAGFSTLRRVEAEHGDGRGDARRRPRRSGRRIAPRSQPAALSSVADMACWAAGRQGHEPVRRPL
jgi:hypothetical protein